MAEDVIEVDETTGEAKPVAVSAASLAHAKNASIVEARKKERMARLADIEDELMDESAIVLKYANRFMEIEPDAIEPPSAWVEEMGQELATRCLRVARAAWMGSKDAPVALKMASATVTGVMKAKANRDHKEAPRFNVAIVQLPAAETAPTAYPVLKVDK